MTVEVSAINNDADLGKPKAKSKKVAAPDGAGLPEEVAVPPDGTMSPEIHGDEEED